MLLVSTRPDVLAYIGLGSNLGQPEATLQAAMVQLAALPLTRLVAQSSLYRSAPFEASGPEFANAVVGLLTRLNAPELLLKLQQIETAAGRERSYRNAPRTLDLDLLLYGTARMHSPRLVLPHPRLFERAFVLLPLAEIAPNKVLPAQLQAVAGQVLERLA